MPVNTMEDYEVYFKKNLSIDAKKIEKKRDKVAPHYKRFYAKVLVLFVIGLIVDLVIQFKTFGEIRFLVAPLGAVVIMLFGSIFIGFRQSFRTRNFQKIFNETITYKLGEIFFKDWHFAPEVRNVSEDIFECGIFDNIFAPTLDGDCFFSKDQYRFFHLKSHYTVRSRRGESGESKIKSHDSQGLFFIYETNEPASGDRWLLLPDVLEKNLGKHATKIAEAGIEFNKAFKTISNPNQFVGEGDSSYGKQLVKCENQAFENAFRAYSDDGNMRLMTEKRQEILAKLAQELGDPFSMAYNSGKLYLYLPLGPFFGFAESDISDDISQFEFYKRFHQDAIFINKIILAFEEF